MNKHSAYSISELIVSRDFKNIITTINSGTINKLDYSDKMLIYATLILSMNNQKVLNFNYCVINFFIFNGFNFIYYEKYSQLMKRKNLCELWNYGHYLY